MSVNFTTDSLTSQKISEYAAELRRFFELDDIDVVDVLRILRYERIPTRFGFKSLTFKIVPDIEIEGDEAVTLITDKHVRIRIADSTYRRAEALDRRARWTVVHEFAHAVLHKNKSELARSRTADQKRVVPAHVSVERQADVFTSYFLMTNALVDQASSVEDLMALAQVSRRAADIRWEDKVKIQQRPAIAVGFRALRQELSATDNGSRAINGTKICPVCRLRSLTPIGVKYLCLGPCGGVLDGFADGDSPSD